MSVELQAECGDFTVTEEASLKWFEEYLGNARELRGWPNCPYDAVIMFTRADGKRFEAEASTDSRTNIISGDIWYFYEAESGNNAKMFEHFGLTTVFWRSKIDGVKTRRQM